MHLRTEDDEMAHHTGRPHARINLPKHATMMTLSNDKHH